jgi:hypothetical protein
MGLIGDAHETEEKCIRNFRRKTCSEETKPWMAGTVKMNIEETG